VPNRVAAPVAPCLVVYAPRERAREFARAAFPRRRCRVILARGADDFGVAMRTELVDGALVDIAAPGDETWRVARLAREFPSAPFFGVAPLRAIDGPGLAQCAVLEFADLLVEGVDDESARALLAPRLFTARFAAALVEPPPSLGLDTALQQDAWRAIVAHAGRAVRTSTLATALGVTREHLSRAFSAKGAPNLKRVIDLVRLVAAAELAKNPGHDVRDIARILGFASSSHLSSTAQRIVGTKSVSLSRLRTVDLVDRFVKGRGRSRG
jgi:AraC-like DNA-binding protein